AVCIHDEMKFVIEEVVMFQRNSPLLMQNQRDRAMHTADPTRQLFSIAHRRRETNQLHMPGGANNRLFPYRAALNVTYVMQFIKDDETNMRQRRRCSSILNRKALSTLFQQHIAVDLSGHDNNRGAAMLNDIPCY